MTYLVVPSQGRKRDDFVVVAVLLVLGMVASGLSREHQNQVEAAVRGTALYPFLEMHRASAERSRVSRRATLLQTERDSLVQLLSRYRALAGQAVLFRTGTGLDRLQLGSVRAAEVYPGRPRVGDPNVFVLRGSGLEKLDFPVGVFTGGGVVGVARSPHGKGARGDFWSHPDFRVSVVTEDGAIPGIVRSTIREGEQPVMLLDGAPFQADIPVGTVLVTTGIGGVYPPGISVGVVRALAESEAGWMKRYVVEPAVRPERIGVALVWVRPELPASVPMDPPEAPADTSSAPAEES